MLLALVLACAGGSAPSTPAAPAPSPPPSPAAPADVAVPPAPSAAPAVTGPFPAELVGTWVHLTSRDGRWVVHQPCDRVIPRLHVPAGDGPLQLEEGQDGTEWTPMAVTRVGEDWTVQARAPDGGVETHRISWYDASRRRLRWDGDGPFVSEAEAGAIEHVVDPVTECYDDPGAGDPLADLGSLPPRLWRIADLAGWRRPPDSGTAPELELDATSRPPRLIRRSGAGERVSTVLDVTPDGPGWWVTVDGEGRGRWGLWIGPWSPPVAPLSPPLVAPDGSVATPTPAPSEVPPPPGSWQVRVGSARGAGVAWVTSLDGAPR